MEIPQSILEKVQKLKALSEGAAKVNSLAESEAAALALNRLLTKYNISLIDLEDTKEKPAIEMNRSELISVMNPYGRLWKERLLMTLCRFNYCQFVASSQKGFIVGSDVNMHVVIDLFNTLASVYLHNGKKRYNDDRINFRGAQLTDKYKRKYLTSYLLGCSIGLYVKLEEIQSQECTSIALCHKELINNYISDNFKIKNKPIKQPKIKESAYLKGYADGKRQPLQKTIS